MNKPVERDLNLDILVAKEILGWSIRQVDSGPRTKHWTLFDRDGRALSWDYGRYRRTARKYPTEYDAWENACPRFSSNMHDAWKVVEQMTAIPTYSRRAAVVAWNTRFFYWWRENADSIVCGTEAETAHAICTEALRIVKLDPTVYAIGGDF